LVGGRLNVVGLKKKSQKEEQCCCWVVDEFMLFIFNVAGLLFVYFLFDFLIFWVKVFLWV
jgi:hypothetical protein